MELSNNIAENSMRPWALGLGGSEGGGNCVGSGELPPDEDSGLEYLLDVLPGLAYRTMSQVAA